MYIYKITNIINGRSYIGQTKNYVARFKQHMAHSKKISRTNELYIEMNIYGIDKFTFDILIECNIESADELEKYYINLFDTYNNGYNQSLGGIGSGKGYIPSKETLIKIANTRKLNDVTRDKRIHSNETKIKMSISKIDKTEYTFFHKEYGYITTTKNNLIKLYNMKDPSPIYKVVNGERNSAYGWRLS